VARIAATSRDLVVWKRATLKNRMREIFTSGSVGGSVEQSPSLPGRYRHGSRFVRSETTSPPEQKLLPENGTILFRSAQHGSRKPRAGLPPAGSTAKMGLLADRGIAVHTISQILDS